MKTILMSLLFFFCFASISWAASNSLQIYQNGKLLGEMTKDQFALLLKAADNDKLYQEELKIERDHKVKVEVTTVNYNEQTGMFSYDFNVIWETDTGEILKKVSLVSSTELPKDKVFYSKLRIFYRDTCEYAAPLACGIAILCLLIIF